MTDKAVSIRDDMTLSELGAVLAKSGFFADTRDAAQAIVKVLAGKEMGFGAIQSMTGINIIQGRVAPSANLLAAAVKRSGKYNYRITEHTDKVCEIAFFEAGQDVGHSRFTIDDARKAGTKNLDKFARNMLFARAMSNGVRWFTPDVTGGPAYTPEELGATVNEAGDVIDAAPPTNGSVRKLEPIEVLAHPDAVPEPDIDHAASWDDPVPAAIPEPALAVELPTATVEKFTLAKMKVLANSAAIGWRTGARALATKYPRYQTVLKGGALSGEVNFHHILGAAAKCGFETVTDDNYQNVLEAIDQRALTMVPEPA